VVADIRSRGGHADFVRADLDGLIPGSRGLADAATSLLGGRIDILVNNAGIFPAANTLTADPDMFDRVYGVNVKAPFFLTQAVVPGMIERGAGVIVNLGSWVARLSVPVGALYASTKGAMETLTRAWAAEFGPQGIRVNAVSPGVVLEGDHPAAAMMTGTPAGRMGTPEEIAAVIVFLCSDDSGFIHGSVLDVDGGRTAAAVLAQGLPTVSP
jgi:NAD(P)-dependent dehydrogenase (short-subunit alcohol dehydrogenase family)